MRSTHAASPGGYAPARRVAALLLLVVAIALPAAAEARFGFEDVIEKARKLAREPYQEPKGQVPEWLLKLTYDQWRDIRFRAERALWRDLKLPFQVQFFHPGLFYDRVVRVNIVKTGVVTPLRFSPSQFDYGKNEFASRVPQELGYAGFRIHYPLKRRDYYDEVIVFLGATYFRALGRDEVFGLSARGLSVDTAESRGEEFPWFREFWLVTPRRGAKEMLVFAILDSPRVTGAYRFAITPGEQTAVKVEIRLFLRREIHKLGIGPLTSMFYHGENTARWFDDWRPEVHDSDGILLRFPTGEWLWRPLDNPKALSVSSLQMENPRGFGLLQRDRTFDHYQDLETRSELRPSAWIEPEGDWGPGRLELVEIPTNTDTNDNAVVYWVPDKGPTPEEPGSFIYTMYWYGEDANRPPAGRVVATRRDSGTVENAQRLVIDFQGKQLEAIPADRVLRGVVTVVGGDEMGELLDQHVVKNTVSGGWRLSFQVRPKQRPVELRAFVEEAGETLTETWSYAVLP